MRTVTQWGVAGSILALLFAAFPANGASVTIINGDFAQRCSKAAHSSSAGSPLDEQAIADCTMAIENEALSVHDLAGTYVNRGVLKLGKHDFRNAEKDFDVAANLDPTSGDAHVNRGAALIAQRRFVEGIAALDRGLALGPDEPWKAYFDRAVADEHLDDMKAAYFDYLKASELKPDWEEPKQEMVRFTVSRRPKS